MKTTIDTFFDDRELTLDSGLHKGKVKIALEETYGRNPRTVIAWITPKGARQMILALTEIADTYKSTEDLFDAIQVGTHFHMNNDVAWEYVKLSDITYALIGGHSIRHSQNIVEGTTFRTKD